MTDTHKHSQARSYKAGEQRTNKVFFLTLVTMLVEVIAGVLTGSMALLADGWHMGTHSAAFGIAIFTYRYVRRNENNPELSFNASKTNALGGFASAVALAVVALFMIIESIERMVTPVGIQVNEAIFVAGLGLLVNVVSAFILLGDGDHSDMTHGHHHDHNLRSAYFHVLADALTSIFAIVALILAKYLDWWIMDPLMGVVGAFIILRWSGTLMNSTSGELIDRTVRSSE